MSALTFVPAGPRPHLAYRGTRIFTAVLLGWVGLIVLPIGSLAVTTSSTSSGGATDPGLREFLNGAAPYLVVLGIVHLVAAVGIGRDRPWSYGLGMWMLAAGVLVTMLAIVTLAAGRDPFAVVDPIGRRDGLGLALWALALYGLVGWGLRRIGEGRRIG
jgi:hypothetical protein